MAVPLIKKTLDHDGLHAGSWIFKNKITNLIDKKIIDRLKSYKNKKALEYTYKKYFLSDKNKKNAIILSSSPKSGNTWMRFVFANIISLKELKGEIVDFHKLEDYMPVEIRPEDMQRPWPYKSIPCIVKTHKPFFDIYSNFRSLLVYRNPLDAMVSQYYYVTTRTGDAGTDNSLKRIEEIRFITEEWKKRGISAYLRHSLGLTRWCHHYKSWINNCSAAVAYEDLKINPLETLNGIFNKLSINMEKEILKEAILRSDFKNIKKLENEFGKSTKMAQLSTNFARKGSVGQWKDYFSQEDINYFKDKMRQWDIDVNKFNYGTDLKI